MLVAYLLGFARGYDEYDLAGGHRGGWFSPCDGAPNPTPLYAIFFTAFSVTLYLYTPNKAATVPLGPFEYYVRDLPNGLYSDAVVPTFDASAVRHEDYGQLISKSFDVIFVSGEHSLELYPVNDTPDRFLRLCRQ
ncbi:hypothetical protein FOL47_008359 [Perkinsus chesapeaki]|uniref:Uncharacterized protein n=1 Tax=Perkinsus chesapeaki TaxID=330153 RepID=A0A7J6LFD3_PERCH|nr:hypothetical protein FOL47_008359 [Perkinsus chesapeaki]